MLLFLLILILIFVSLSAFFSGSETALLSLSKIKIKHWIYTRLENQAAWTSWLTKPEELMTTILVGNTIVNVFMSSMMTMMMLEILGPDHGGWKQALGGLVSFMVVLIFGEIVPKLYCRQNPEKTSYTALGILYQLSHVLGTPVTQFLEWLGSLIPLFKRPYISRSVALSLEEIKTITLEPTAMVGISKEHQEMIGKVLDLHQITASQIMVPWQQVDFLTMEEALEGGVQLKRFLDRWIESGRTRVPLLERSPSPSIPIRVLGYLYVKDLLFSIAQGSRVGTETIRRWIHPLPVVQTDQKISELIEIFRFGSPMALVDHASVPQGILTLEDILEEFVGEILDEYDIEEREVK